VETDGRRWHDPKDAREFDRRRANSCASLGWRLLRFTWAEVLHDPAYVIATVRASLAEATAVLIPADPATDAPEQAHAARACPCV
jgi:very-short-patch-repair endonuclease